MAQEKVLAVLAPSPARRWFAIATVLALGATLLYLGTAGPSAGPGWRIFLLALGAGSLALAETLRRATSASLVLTESELRDSAGRRLCRVSDIAGVDRGAFAFKPSNGFLVRLDEPGDRAWRPGLWWRLGRRIGVGGATSSAQAKFMADSISALILARDGP